MIGIAAALALIAGPLLLGLTGLIHSRRTPTDAIPDYATPWNWRLTISSALLYALAFNLIFFIQELFLVLPKALTPGLRPTLFHNNHSWEGEHPIGAINPRNDIGMAMDYLHLGATAKTVAALVALAAIPLAALCLIRFPLSLAEDPAYIASPRTRTRFIFYVATLPALTAILLIIPFRVPREFVEVVMLPVVVTIIGIAWIQAGAWRVTGVKAEGVLDAGSVAYPLGAVLLLLLIFQLLLRPGIQFY